MCATGMGVWLSGNLILNDFVFLKFDYDMKCFKGRRLCLNHLFVFPCTCYLNKCLVDVYVNLISNEVCFL